MEDRTMAILVNLLTGTASYPTDAAAQAKVGGLTLDQLEQITSTLESRFISLPDNTDKAAMKLIAEDVVNKA
jgi:hypothetical protein